MIDYVAGETRRAESAIRRKRIMSIYDEVIEALTIEAVKGDLATIRVLNALLVNVARLENFI